MEFGKVEQHDLAGIDFTLHADDPRTREVLHAAGSTGQLRRIGIGCPVWAAKSWVGQVYPPYAKPSEWLFHYARQFNSIELNTTHYRIPDLETIARWRAETPAGFKFCAKFPQEISHRRPISSHAPRTSEFVTRVMALGDRMGPSFLQLPPTFAPLDLADLKLFLKSLPRDFSIAVEVRHPGFFKDHALHDDLFALLQLHGARSVITDVSGRRDVLHFSLPTPQAMVRFIGNDLDPSDDVRFEAWSMKLAEWEKAGLKEIEFFVHQPGDTNAPEAVSRLIARLNTRLKTKSQVWTPVAAIAPEPQLSWF